MKKIKMGILAIFLLFIVSFLNAQERHPLTGEWEFLSGNEIYFFLEADLIIFRVDGTVSIYEDGKEDDAGTWTVFGSERLRIDSGGGRRDKYTDNFTFSIVNNILTIVDEDGDMCRWRRKSR